MAVNLSEICRMHSLLTVHRDNIFQDKNKRISDDMIHIHLLCDSHPLALLARLLYIMSHKIYMYIYF